MLNDYLLNEYVILGLLSNNVGSFHIIGYFNFDLLLNYELPLAVFIYENSLTVAFDNSSSWFCIFNNKNFYLSLILDQLYFFNLFLSNNPGFLIDISEFRSN